MIRIHRSNRVERLVDALASVACTPVESTDSDALDPFVAECIVVQSRGMERWLSMALAQRMSIWANPYFPFPRSILERAFQAVLGDAGDSDGVDAAAGYSESALGWSIAARLPRHLERDAFAPIAGYLKDDRGGDMLLQLSERLARVFDDYVVYRPGPDDLITRWQSGSLVGVTGTELWQAQLWRDLHETLGDGHVAARARTLVTALEAGTGPIEGFPRRLCLFGIASLPPLYLRLFSALSQRIEVHLFMLSPSREYWGEIRPAAGRSPQEMAAGHHEQGHPLLASLGRVGRDFHQEFEASVDYVEADDSLYEDPGQGSMLEALQSDMLDLRDRCVGGEHPPLNVAADDRSIVVHACHGPMREIEVLHDQLVEVLGLPDVSPRDIVVMAPDIDAYAPFIEAVFGVTAQRPAIAYRISDRRLGRTHGVIDALESILEALEGRMQAGVVLDLLAREPIRQRFAIADEELEVVRQWVADSGIRWGVDAEHRAEVGQPPMADNTWRFGFDRMLLGYAIGDGSTGQGDRTLFEGRLPFGDVEGGDVALLGRLSHFCQTLFAFRTAVMGVRTLPQWRDTLLRVIDELLSSEGELAAQHQVLRDALSRLVDAARSADFVRPVDLRAVRRRLYAQIEEGATARGFLSGGVTFCQLVPMRSIPFKVVCLIGMNDEAFPRRPLRVSFDLIASGRPRRGDRSPPDDDRYLFLEAILSARQRLIITYEGHGIHDNGVKPPSVLVGELLSTLARSFRFGSQSDETADAEAQLVVHHRLQPFSPHYFGGTDDARLFSYARQYFEGARSLGGGDPPPPFVDGPLPAPPEPIVEVLLDDLEAFFGHPIRRFLQRRLGLFHGDEVVAVEGREPVTLDALARWQIGDDMLAAALRGNSPGAIEAIMRASGKLPLGTPGQLVLRALLPTVDRLVAETARHTDRQPALPPRAFALELGSLRIHGVMRELWPTAQLRTQYSRVGGRHDVRLWVRHLVLCALREAGQFDPAQTPDTSLLIGRSGGTVEGTEVSVVRFGAVTGATDLLADLLELYQLGQRFPLPMEASAGLAHAEALAEGKPDAVALDSARARFEDRFGGLTDPYIQQVYPSFDAMRAPGLAADFEQISRRVLQPLVEYREQT